MAKNIFKIVLKAIGVLLAMALLMAIIFIGKRQWRIAQVPDGLEMVGDGEVQLYLHTDPVLIDTELMISCFEEASAEVLKFLGN